MGDAAPSRILKDVFNDMISEQEVRRQNRMQVSILVDQRHHRQPRQPIVHYRKFGLGDLSQTIEAVDWLWVLRETERFQRLEGLFLPLTIHQFLSRFTYSDNDISQVISPSNANDNIDLEDITSTSQAGEGKVRQDGTPDRQEQAGILQNLPFPACATLCSLSITGFENNEPGLTAEDGERLAKYFIRWMPRLKHLKVQRSPWKDFTFLDSIAPPALELSQSHHRKCLNRLESIEISFIFLSRSEFLNLPGREEVISLQQQRNQLIEEDLEDEDQPQRRQYLMEQMERAEQQLLLDSRPIQVHDERMNQFLGILGRFQRRTIPVETGGLSSSGSSSRSSSEVTGLKRIKMYQSGIPKSYVDKIEAHCAELFPELSLTIISQ
jgi:hypothetical protein